MAETEEGVFKMKIQLESHLAREFLPLYFLKIVLCAMFPCRHMCIPSCACTYARTWRPEDTLCSETGSLIGLELTDKASLAGQGALGTSLSLLPRC